MEMRGDGIHYRASGRPRRQNIIDEPIAPVLAHCDIAEQACSQQHLVGRLEHSLQVRRVALGKRNALGELCQADSPGQIALFSRYLHQPVQASGDW